MNRAPAVLAAIVLLFALSAGQAQAMTADSADDVCPVTADPCVVTDVVEVVPGAILDFVNRAVEVTGDGRFDFGEGSGRILSGRFETSTEGAAIVAGGGNSTSRSGSITIDARRLCDAGIPQGACLGNADCQLGACDARRCTGKPSQVCTSDTACAGTCTSRRCSNSVALLRCTTDAECNFGTCSDQLTCRNGIQARNCSADADCNLGTCTVGEGSIMMNGSTNGRSGDPALLKLRAADSVTIAGSVDLSGVGIESDGGALEIVALSGDVTISGPIDASGRGQGQGGEVWIQGERNIALSGPIDLTGGAYGGGVLEAEAYEGDIVLLADVNLRAKSGSGYGGEMYLDAGRDVLIGNGLEALRILASGHTDRTDAGGGGIFEISAGRDVTIARRVRIVAMGVGPGSFGGDAEIYADDDFTFDSQFLARSRGIEGAGGTFQVYAMGDILVGGDSKFDVRGDYGAILDFESEEADARFGGLVRLNGLDELETGSLSIVGCDVDVSATVINKVIDGYTYLSGRNSIHLLSQGRLLAPHGDVFLEYGNPALLPVIEGKIDSTVHTVLGYYGTCTACGDGVVDYWEDCDDGNSDDGDGCNSDCAVE